jgi:hypothetical protein
MMKGYIEVSSRKGGVGTTTTACGIALSLESMGNTVLILDTTGTDSVTAVLGLNGLSPEWQGITVKNIHVDGKNMPPHGDYDYVVVDAGSRMFDYPDETASVKRVCVLRNEYLGVRLNMYQPVDVFMSFTIETNALTAGDVHNVIGKSKNVISAPMNSRLARSIDAGLFPNRWHDVASEWSNAIVSSFMAVTP